MSTNASVEVQYVLTPGTTSVFSLSAQLQAEAWLQVTMCVVWIVLGLLLVFFGWSSYSWGAKTKLGPKARNTVSRTSVDTTPFGGGIGGCITGFLFSSFLTLVVTSAVCIPNRKTVSPTTLFIIWLLSGMFGLCIGGHWPLFARFFSGLLAGACSSIVITAVFGIHTVIVRTVVLLVLSCLIITPLLIPRRTLVHFHVLNACTSVVGMVVFLNGVALYAPPRTSSSAWIDLWALLLARDGSDFAANTVQSWGTSSFKGYIAGAILGSMTGFVFELIFHKESSHGTEDQWNDYLGLYTQRLEKGKRSDLQNRMGVFEPAPSRWQKVKTLVGLNRGPTAYQNLTFDQQIESRALTEMSKDKRTRIARGRSHRMHAAPAKFQTSTIRVRDLETAASDSEATDDDTEDTDDKFGSMHKPHLNTKGPSPRSFELAESTEGHSAQYALSHTTESSKMSDRCQSIPSVRPPSYRTTSDKSGAELSPHASPTRPMTFVSNDPPFSSTAPVPATPSLLNAIARIQAAQAQALANVDAHART